MNAAPQPRLRRWVIPTAIGLGVCLALGIVLAPILIRQIPMPTFSLSGEQEAAQQPVVLPDDYRAPTTTYGAPKKAEPQPQATAAVQASLAPIPGLSQLTGPTPPPPPGLGQAQPQARPDTSRVPVATLVEDTQAQRPQQGPAQQSQQQVQPQGQEKQKRTPWVIVPQDISIKRGGGTPTKREQEDSARKAEASKLIQPATWARPAKPWLTLFMDQKLAGKLLDNVNSDQPGLFNIETTVPIFDGAGWEWELLPKGSKITVRQEGKPDFGANTLAVKVVQIRLPGPKGIVMMFPGGVGDENGANGMRGKTNNHYDKLILATGINALLSLGSNALAGTPSGYYANPGQQAARETAQSVSKDVKSFTDAQLRVPPTITKKAGEFVTIQLEQNLTFSQNPVVIR